jgi:hypothetical protein
MKPVAPASPQMPACAATLPHEQIFPICRRGNIAPVPFNLCVGARSVGGQITVGVPAKRLPREVRQLVEVVIARGLTERAWRIGN